MKYYILLPFHTNIKFLNVFKTSPFCPYCVPDIATWPYQTNGFRMLMHIGTHISSSPFHIGTFLCVSLICLSYINKSFVMEMSYRLPRAKLLRVTFFMKWSYLLPRISCVRHTRIPVFALKWDLVCLIHYIHHKSRDSIHGNFAYSALICAIWSSRGRAGKKVSAVIFFRCPTVRVLTSSFNPVWFMQFNLTRNAYRSFIMA